jgi:transcriptional regulator with XRE-family HTH domain
MAKQEVPQFEMRHRMELAMEYGNVSVAEMAKELGVSRTTISNFLHGRTIPRRGNLIVWSVTCGVPLDWLIDGDVPEPVATPEPEAPKTRKPSKRARTQDNGHSRWSVDIPAQSHNVRRGAA